MTMKRMIAWILILTLLLSGCGSKNADVAGSGVNMAPGAAEEPSNEIPGETAAEVTAEENTEMTTEPTEPETTAPEPSTTVPDAPAADEDEPPFIFSNSLEGIHPPLADLLRANKVTPAEIRIVVGDKGYFPADMPVQDYPLDFVEGCLIAAWPSVYESVLKDREGLPF